MAETISAEQITGIAEISSAKPKIRSGTLGDSKVILKFKCIDEEETALCKSVPKRDVFPLFLGIYEGGRRDNRAFVWEKVEGTDLRTWMADNCGRADQLRVIKRWCNDLESALVASKIPIPLDINFANFVVRNGALVYVDIETKGMRFTVDDLFRAILQACRLPGSIHSYVVNALNNNFQQLKDHILHDSTFVAAKATPGQDSDRLLEEMFRYLYLLADSSSDGVIRSSPSYFVGEAFHCLMLDPVLYWKVCDAILNMHGKYADDVKMRVLPHNAMSGRRDDEEPRKCLYGSTMAQYKKIFGEDPPSALWPDINNDLAMAQADLEARVTQKRRRNEV